MKAIQRIQDFDVSMVKKIIDSDSYLKILPISYSISSTSSYGLYLMIACFSLMINGFYHLYFWTLLTGLAIERSVYFILKNTLKRKRPYKIISIKHHLIPDDVFSFPSGHTSSAFLLAAITGSFYPVMLIPMMIWALLVGLSRIVLGVHFPTDIVIGMFLGLSMAHITLNYVF